MRKIQILWADDEIELLKPHIIFLENKGYEITTVISAQDAIDECKQKHFDVVILDENMPGLSGLECLLEIKKENPSLPVIMITKSEEEDIMEQAIGQKISDYLIKPVNPLQILMSLKKVVNSQEIIMEKTTVNYRAEFMRISNEISDKLSSEQWKKLYKDLVFGKWNWNKQMRICLKCYKCRSKKLILLFLNTSRIIMKNGFRVIQINL